jgi:hypothetical protein
VLFHNRCELFVANVHIRRWCWFKCHLSENSRDKKTRVQVRKEGSSLQITTNNKCYFIIHRLFFINVGSGGEINNVQVGAFTLLLTAPNCVGHYLSHHGVHIWSNAEVNFKYNGSLRFASLARNTLQNLIARSCSFLNKQPNTNKEIECGGAMGVR